MDKANVVFYRDNNDLIVVIRNCKKDILDLVRCFASTATEADIAEIPTLGPAVEPEDKKPVIPKEESKPQEATIETEKIPEKNLENSEVPVKEHLVQEDVVTNISTEPEPITKIGGPICPKCKAVMSLDADKALCACGFKVDREYSSKVLNDEELTTLINDGKTDTLSGFISKRNGNPFSGKLVLNKNTGRVTYDFK